MKSGAVETIIKISISVILILWLASETSGFIKAVFTPLKLVFASLN